jgi:hypothetical protein
MKLSLIYYYKGSTNCYLRLEQSGDVILLYTDYNELITTIQTAHELVMVINELSSGKYA